MRATLEERVFFDYDGADVREDARRTLDSKISLLRNAPAIRLRIEGHADERGSTEYNRALGMRRATSVVNYLAGYGIDASRLQTVSYGEERPLARRQNKSAWGRTGVPSSSSRRVGPPLRTTNRGCAPACTARRRR